MAVEWGDPRLARRRLARTAAPTDSATQSWQGALIDTNLKGRLVHSIGVEQPIMLTEATVTANRIVLDWTHDGQPGHLIAKSPNGIHFSGRYGYGRERAGFECELTLYRSNHEDLLYGTWRQHDTELVGTLILRLPKAVEARLAEIALTGDVRQSAQRQRAADAPPAKQDAPVAAEGKVAALRLAPGTSAKTPSPRTAKPATKMAWTNRPPAVDQTEKKQAAPAAPQPAPATPPASASVDHLLVLTAEQFGQYDRAELEKELLAAPVSALFKVAHNALAADLRGMAARMFAERYGDPPLSPPPKPARPVETPEMKARKRRSSRHKTNR
ncbi:MAG TPA: hypothetical protein VHY91_19320 [Pirellulales bacterium]|jgi:hypothetical protein|nr:hypothetical protein [Pirellulales bacterium]